MSFRAAAAGLLATAVLVALPARAVQPPRTTPRGNLDVRGEGRGQGLLRAPGAGQRAAAAALEAAVPDLTLRWDGLAGSPRWVAAPPGGALAEAASSDPEQSARAFLLEHARLFGLSPAEVQALRTASVVPSSSAGAVHVAFVQVVDGIDVHQGRARVHLDAAGRVTAASSRLFGGVHVPGAAAIDAAEAVRLAARDVYPDRVFAPRGQRSSDRRDAHATFEDEGWAADPEARLVLFPEAIGTRLAWEVGLAEPGRLTDYRVLVDAHDGRVLWRRNRTVYADARILEGTGPDPASSESGPAQHVLRPIPTGWIAGDGSVLQGNNASAHRDYVTEGGPAEPSGIYEYPYASAESALVNAWWWVNDAHDRFDQAGFDEVAGNYQADGGDAMKVVLWGPGGRDNAFYTPSVDGGTSSVNFLWVSCRTCADRDDVPENGGERSAGLMRDVVVHEYAHGVTTRMVGGPAADDCLQGLQSGAMGEGWSDLFAASFDGDPRIGEYFFEGPGFMRDLRHDLTYGDLCRVGDGGCAVHSDGMIWAGTLWDLRRSMLALDPVGGLDRFHRIVVEGLSYTACYPDMLDARDGILQADTALHGSAHHALIWNAFAKRRMGQNATSAGEDDAAPVTGTAVPTSFACTPPATPSGVTAAASGANAVRVRYTAATGTRAVEIWREDTGVPHDVRVQVGATGDLTGWTDPSVQGGRTYAYHVVALGAGGVTCRSASSATAMATATGTCDLPPVFTPGLTLAQGGGCSVRLSWSAAQPGCAGDAVTYNVYRGTSPGFEPSERLLMASTQATSIDDVPPQDGTAAVYLVTAEARTPDEPARHTDAGSAQVLQWRSRVPATGRSTVTAWSFDAGASGWTTDNTGDATGGWVLVDPVATSYGGATFSPDTGSSGSGLAWVTGHAASPGTVAATDADRQTKLISPVFDGTGGATLLSFDIWAHETGNGYGGLVMDVSNGTTTKRVTLTRLMLAQSFAATAPHGWQRLEVDLATLVPPTSTMKVTFVSVPSNPLSEFGVDAVQLDRATVCGRSGLRLASVAVDDGKPGWGNGNGVLEPGETARLTLTVANDGALAASGPRATARTWPAGLVVHEGTASLPAIAAGASAASTGPGITLTADPRASCDDALVLELDLTDDSGAHVAATWTPEYGTRVTDVVFRDTFASDTGWIVEGDGAGRWQRGDPVGTSVSGTPASPETDSPNDPDALCYVTENGVVGGAASASDVDPGGGVGLYSPIVDLSAYKHARVRADVWYYDSSTSDQNQDYGSRGAYVDEPIMQAYDIAWDVAPTSGWVARTHELTEIPFVGGTRLFFEAYDTSTDHVVEYGVDNVRVEGDRQACAASGIDARPNGIGSTLRVTKSEGAVRLTWSAAPADAAHDPAAYYRVHVAPAPTGAFVVADTATGLSSDRAPGGAGESYLVSAVNGAGTSGDEPAP